MSKKHHNPVYSFIMQDVKNESESKNLAVLIRLLDICFALYFLYTSVFTAYLEHYNFSLVLIFSIGLLVGSFFCTYENKTQLAQHLFNAVIVITTAYMTIAIGYLKNYHWLMFITILVAFFNMHLSMKFKIIYSVLISAIMLGITVYAVFFPSAGNYETTATAYILFANVITYAIAIIIVAYSYCKAFMQSDEKILQYNRKLMRMASLDTLTQLYNRRHMNEQLADMALNTAKTNRSFCIAIGDVDLFKTINDTYGHDAGDYVLVTLADIFRNFMEGRGVVSRWGGEEFLFAFKSYNFDLCYNDLEELRNRIDNYKFAYKDDIINVTMTFGVEEYDEHIGIETTISRADVKLYNGKKEGRNRVVR